MNADPSELGLGDLQGRVVRAVSDDVRVKFIYLFGSRAGGRGQPESDIDLAVWADPPLSLREAAELEGLLAARLDEPDLGEVDLLVLNDAPMWLQFRVLGEGIVIFSRDEALRVSFRERVEKQFLDFRHLHDAYLAGVRTRARAGVLSRG